MGALAALGAPLAAGSSQGQLQGTQELIGLQQAQQERALKQQGIDVERLKAMAELTGPARQEALKRGLELEQGLPDQFGYWDTLVKDGKMSQEEADQNKQNYQRSVDGYKSFGMGTDATGLGVAQIHTPGATASQVLPMGQRPGITPTPAGTPSTPPSVGAAAGAAASPSTPPSAGSSTSTNPGSSSGIPPTTATPRPFYPTPNGQLAVGSSPTSTPPAAPQPPNRALFPNSQFGQNTSRNFNEIFQDVPGAPIAGTYQSARASVPPSQRPPSQRPASNAAIPPPGATPSPSPAAPAAGAVGAPSSSPTSPTTQTNPTTQQPTAGEGGAPPGFTPQMTFPGGVVFYTNAQGQVYVSDPNKVATPWTEADKQAFVLKDAGVIAAQKALNEAIARRDAAYNYPGGPSPTLQKLVQDLQDKLTAATEKAYDHATSISDSAVKTGEAYSDAFGRTAAGQESLSQMHRTEVLLPGEQSKQQADLNYTKAQTDYENAQTDAEKQTALANMYDARKKQLELQSYPAEEAQKLAKGQVDVETGQVDLQKKSLDFKNGKLGTKDPGLLDNYNHIYLKSSARESGGVGIPGAAGVRSSSSESGDSVDVSRAWATIKGAEKWTHDPDPDVRRQAQTMYDDGLRALGIASSLVTNGGSDMVRGPAPSQKSLTGRQLWTQYGDKQTFLKRHGIDPRSRPSTWPSDVREGVSAMDAWTNFYYNMEGTAKTTDATAFASSAWVSGKGPRTTKLR